MHNSFVTSVEEDKDGTDSSSDSESQQNVSQVPEKPPELKKYWEAVRKHPGDFTGWTYLLQYVEQKVSPVVVIFVMVQIYCILSWSRCPLNIRMVSTV